MRLHAHNPVVKGQLALGLFQNSLKFLNGLLVGELPSVVLNFHDLAEALVLCELAVDAFQIFLVLFKDLKETLHSKDIPPAVLLHDTEAATKNVSNITTATDV